MSERPEAAVAAVTLPDRVTVLTCLGCGAMGREEGCGGNCSEHRLPLVAAGHHEALVDAARAARVRAAELAPVVRRFAADGAEVGDARSALLRLRAHARAALRDAGRHEGGVDWAAPATVIGWWCARCGNVDMPQPCIGVCVWRPAEWVNVAVYERELRQAMPSLHCARSLSGFLARAAAVTPRAGQERRNREALRVQARAALAACDS